MESDERHQFIDIANKTMIKVTTFVLRLATAILSMGVVCGASWGYGTGQPQVTGSVKLTGSDNGFCQTFGLKNGCDANYVLQSTLYSDGSVFGKLTDVGKVPGTGNEAILVQADVDCMKFFFIGGNKYAVVGGVYTKGDKLVDILELDAPFVGSRFKAFAKEDVDGVVFYSSVFDTTDTCDDVTEDDVETRNYYETVDGQAIIVFPSDPVTCGDFDGKQKECRKSKQCEWDTNEGTCVSSLGGIVIGMVDFAGISPSIGGGVFRVDPPVDPDFVVSPPSPVPVNCGEVEGKKDCRKSKECEWDTNEETCSVSSLGVLRGESLSNEEAQIQDMANGSNSADPKMIMPGLVAGFFFALWL